jgi:hypothetical protein
MASSTGKSGRGGTGAKKKGSVKVSSSPQNQKEFDSFIAKELENDISIYMTEIKEKTGLPPEKIKEYVHGGKFDSNNKWKLNINGQEFISTSPAQDAQSMFQKNFQNLTSSEKKSLFSQRTKRRNEADKLNLFIGGSSLIRRTK